MGILKKIFDSKSNDNTPKINWIPLTTLNQLEDIKNETKAVGVFKHSTRCGTSMMVKRRFESNFNVAVDEIDMYYLDVLSYRAISNELEIRYNLRHESPQLLIIKNNQLIADGSHGGIIDLDLKSVV